MNTHSPRFEQAPPLGTTRYSEWRIAYSTLVYGLFFFFMLYGYVSGWPYSGRTAGEFADYLANSDQGDASRQVFFLLMLVLVTACTARHLKKIVLVAYQPLLFLIFFWMLFSSVWAVDSVVSVKRSVLAIIISVIILNSLAYLGTQRMFDLLYKSLILLLIVNLLSVIIVPGWSIHMSEEYDEGLIGAWKGIMIHKNDASGITAASIIMFFHRFYLKKRWVDLALTVLAVIFLIGTKGKTSLGFVFPSILFAVFYRSALLSEHPAKLLTSALLFTAAALSVFYGVFQADIKEVFSDPQSFTGRVAIWETVLQYVHQHPWLGSGYGAFWQLGEKSPVFFLNLQQMWLTGVAHSHNGYIEMLVMTGIIGMVLSILYAVVMPFVGLYTVPRAAANEASGWVGIWLFCVLTNLMETRLLVKDLGLWTFMLIAITSLHMIRGRYRPRKTGYE